jgi:hypothetical protein
LTVNVDQQAPAASSGSQAERSDAVLAAFIEGNPGAKKAANSLRAGAEVAIMFTDVPGTWRVFINEAGDIAFDAQPATDPDFELHVPPQALREICAGDAQDLGDLGVAFFEHLVAKDPERRIHATVHSGVVKLTRRGWLGLLTQGGTKVVMWMGRKGLRGPGAVAGALGRLRGK